MLPVDQLLEMDRIPAGWTLQQILEATERLSQVYRTAIGMADKGTHSRSGVVDKTENLFWQIMWFQDEILKRCGHGWDERCPHITLLAAHY